MADGMIARHWSDHLRSQRLAPGISLGELARRIGYSNVAKGARRIETFENRGIAKPKDLPLRIAEALGVNDDELRQIAWLDYLAWHRWLNEPVPMKLVVRMMPAIYCRECLPEEITPEQAEKFAARVAKERRRQVCLVVSRRLSVYFDQQGEVIARNEAPPFVQIGGRKFLFEGG
jgi:hypothetical protein